MPAQPKILETQKKAIVNLVKYVTYSSNYMRNNNEVKVDRRGLTYLLGQS